MNTVALIKAGLRRTPAFTVVNHYRDRHRDRQELLSALRLLTSNRSTPDLFVSALTFALARFPSREDKALWATIEARRHELLARTDYVDDVDFGAGNPHAQYTVAQQHAGVHTKRAVKQITSSSKSPLWGRVLYYLARIRNRQRGSNWAHALVYQAATSLLP